jgi:hypothetical protein
MTDSDVVKEVRRKGKEGQAMMESIDETEGGYG